MATITNHVIFLEFKLIKQLQMTLDFQCQCVLREKEPI